MTSVVSFLTSKPDFHPVVIENGRSLHTSPDHANNKLVQTSLRTKILISIIAFNDLQR